MKTITPTLYLTFMRVPYFAEGLMFNLSATYVSIITKLLNYKMSNFQKNKYLNPLRDMIEYKDWIDNKIASGYYVSIIGKDVPKLVRRIRDPIKYYSTNEHKERITVWLAVVPITENSIQNSIETENGTINLQSTFLLPPVKFNAYSPNDYFIENNNIYFTRDGYFSKFPNVVYENNRVWLSHIPYNNNGIDIMFFISTNYILNEVAKIYLSPWDNVPPSIVMFHESNTQNRSSDDKEEEEEDKEEEEEDKTIGTHYMNIFSDSLSIGSSINNYFNNNTELSYFDNSYNSSIKLSVDSAHSEYINYGAIYIPLEHSSCDFFRSTNMDVNTLCHT